MRSGMADAGGEFGPNLSFDANHDTIVTGAIFILVKGQEGQQWREQVGPENTPLLKGLNHLSSRQTPRGAPLHQALPPPRAPWTEAGSMAAAGWPQQGQQVGKHATSEDRSPGFNLSLVGRGAARPALPQAHHGRTTGGPAWRRRPVGQRRPRPPRPSVPPPPRQRQQPQRQKQRQQRPPQPRHESP